MRIAATRSFRIYRLEVPNPKFRMVSIRFELRSTEVDRGRDSVWAISRRPEACRSSESHQHAGAFMLYIVEVVAGPSSGKKKKKVLGMDKDQTWEIFLGTNRLR